MTTLAIAERFQGIADPGSGVVCRARIVRTDGAIPDASAFLSLSYSITDTSVYPQQVVQPLTTLLPVGDYFFFPPVIDSNWLQDTVGYNFQMPIPAGIMNNLNHIYLIQCQITADFGGDFQLSSNHEVLLVAETIHVVVT